MSQQQFSVKNFENLYIGSRRCFLSTCEKFKSKKKKRSSEKSDIRRRGWRYVRRKESEIEQLTH